MSGSEQNGVVVEFLGLAESRAGRASRRFAAVSRTQLLNELQDHMPQFVEYDAGGVLRLKRPWILNMNGDGFLGEEDTPFRNGDIVLLMSVDAGG